MIKSFSEDEFSEIKLFQYIQYNLNVKKLARAKIHTHSQNKKNKMKLSKTKLRNDKLMRITQWQNSNIKKE